MTDRELLDRMFYHPQGGVEWQVFLRAFENEAMCFQELEKFHDKGVLPQKVRDYCKAHLAPKDEKPPA